MCCPTGKPKKWFWEGKAKTNFRVSWLISTFSINFKGYFRVGSSRVTFLLLRSKRILARIAVTATTPTPTAIGRAWKNIIILNYPAFFELKPWTRSKTNLGNDWIIHDNKYRRQWQNFLFTLPKCFPFFGADLFTLTFQSYQIWRFFFWNSHFWMGNSSKAIMTFHNVAFMYIFEFRNKWVPNFRIIGKNWILLESKKCPKRDLKKEKVMLKLFES